MSQGTRDKSIEPAPDQTRSGRKSKSPNRRPCEWHLTSRMLGRGRWVWKSFQTEARLDAYLETLKTTNPSMADRLKKVGPCSEKHARSK